MPNNDDDRLSINFSKRPDLLEMVRREADNDERSISAVIVRLIAYAYQQKKLEAELFIQNQSRAGQKDGVPVFETPTPSQIEAARALKIREQHGQEKS